MNPILKYDGYSVVMQEIPDEISLAFEVTNCPYHCGGCHSKYLWEDRGEPLKDCWKIIDKYKGYVTCVLFMGGDFSRDELANIAINVKDEYGVKVALYSGSDNIDLSLTEIFDYYKVGHYDAKFGGLKQKTTNQRLYQIDHNNQMMNDITYKLQKKIND